ncbi:MAG: hypothetical protein AB2552_11170 [Candidatus Thiodiazotropha endolucinida]
MRISEYRIHCEMCELLSHRDGAHGFTVQVPIDTESQQKERLIATIHCLINKQSHQLTLRGLNDSSGQVVNLSKPENDKLASVLKSVEEDCLCGNAKICPQRIVELVSKLHDGRKV